MLSGCLQIHFQKLMNLHAYGSCYFNVQDIIIKTFVLQFIITKGPMSHPALSVCLRLFQTVQRARDFITECVQSKYSRLCKNRHMQFVSLPCSLSNIKCITVMDKLSFRIIMSSPSDRERQQATPIQMHQTDRLHQNKCIKPKGRLPYVSVCER